jgi:SOS-response transcriptional repressor LexA
LDKAHAPTGRSPDKADAVYNFIAAYIAANAIPPTLDEIAQACGLSGRSHAAYWLIKLRDRGLVAWQPAHPRTIRLLPVPAVSPERSEGGAENPVAGGLATPKSELDL